MSINGIGRARDVPRVCRLLLVVVALSPAIARAQEPEVPDLRSEDTALWLSLGSTLVPTAAGMLMIAADDGEGSLGATGSLLASSGALLGPATGYWYGGASGRGWKGVGIRMGTGLVGTLAIVAICAGDRCDLFDDNGATTGAALVALAATGVILGSAIYDIAKVKSHVRTANDRKIAQASPALSIAPLVSPSGGGTVGIVGQLRF